ncbi:hypothetical protein LF95_21790 [Thalassospira sp. TSL5-1]|nr:hypothetical protein LF95_21790 [Thalassospira sp. TSL5-1]
MINRAAPYIEPKSIIIQITCCIAAACTYPNFAQNTTLPAFPLRGADMQMTVQKAFGIVLGMIGKVRVAGVNRCVWLKKGRHRQTMPPLCERMMKP